MSIIDQILSALSSYGIKPEGKDKYRCKSSPFRPGSDSNSFTLMIDGDQLVWHDHRENRGGGMIELARALNIELPRTTVAHTKRAYTSLSDYAEAHGLTESDLRAAMWRATIVKGRAALEFPTETGKRWRFIDGNSPYYMSEPGYKRCWYGLRHSNIKAAIDQRWPIIIANGEISVVAAAKYGIPAICVTSGEKAQIPDELIQELRIIVPSDSPIIIALDCDDKGRTAAQGMWRQLATHWQSVRAVDLHLSSGGDLADYVRLHQYKAYEMLGQLPSLPQPRKAKATIPQEIVVGQVGRATFIWARDVHQLPPIEWLIKGEIPHRALTVIYGPPGSGKSFVAIDLCLRVAQHATVAYIAGEGETGLQYRIAAWRNYHHKSEGQLLLGMGALNLVDDIEALVALLEPHKPRLIVLDTLARSMGDLDENMTRDMNRVVAQCNVLIDALDCAVIIVHHTGKNGEYRGSSALHGAVDAFIRITDEDDLIRLEDHKLKDHSGGMARYYRLQPVDTGKLDDDGQPIFTPVLIEADPGKEEELRNLTAKQRRTLEIANMGIYREGLTFSELIDLTKYSKPTLSRILEVLRKNGYIAQENRREAYKITEKGMAVFGDGPDDVAQVAEVALVHQFTTATSESAVVNLKTNATNATNATRKRAKRLFGGDNDKTHYDYEG